MNLRTNFKGQKEAAWRVYLKRNLRKLGFVKNPTLKTSSLEKMYYELTNKQAIKATN